MGIFNSTGVSPAFDGKRGCDYVQFRPYCAIVAPPLLPKMQRDAFLAAIGIETAIASTTLITPSFGFTNRIAFVALAVLVFLLIVLGVLWRLHIL